MVVVAVAVVVVVAVAVSTTTSTPSTTRTSSSAQGIVPPDLPPFRYSSLFGFQFLEPSVVWIEASAPRNVLGLFDQPADVEPIQGFL